MMKTLIMSQGKQTKVYKLGELTHDFHSTKSGVVVAIDSLQMANIARFAGAPMDKGAGVDLFKILGDKVKRGELLYQIYSEYPVDFNFAVKLCKRRNGYIIGKDNQIPDTFAGF